jgi:DNA-binding IclR family transcriptional regulator
MKHKSYSDAKTVQKAFKLLEFLGERQSAKPSDMVQQLKLTRSNVHRLLSTLEQLGYINKSDDFRYCLSFKVFILGTNIPKENQLSEISHPFMCQLAELTQENVNLAIMYEQEVLYIKKIKSPHYLKLDQPIGKTDPLHCTALGKVMLSGLTEEELEGFYGSAELPSYTKNTITDHKELIRAIQDVRERGFAIDLQEVMEGVHCISAPVRDHINKIVAAISVSAPAFRLPEEKIDEIRVPLIETCAEISRKMGYMAGLKNKDSVKFGE